MHHFIKDPKTFFFMFPPGSNSYYIITFKLKIVKGLLSLKQPAEGDTFYKISKFLKRRLPP